MIWADEEAVSIHNQNGLKSREFPNFLPRESLCIYGLDDQLITCNGPNAVDETGGNEISGDDEEDVPAGDETIEDPITLPWITTESGEEFNQKFKFAEGDNYVVSSFEADENEEKLWQSTAVTINGSRFFLTAEYVWDGELS